MGTIDVEVSAAAFLGQRRGEVGDHAKNISITFYKNQHQ
jgi:hypothetical protein